MKARALTGNGIAPGYSDWANSSSKKAPQKADKRGYSKVSRENVLLEGQISTYRQMIERRVLREPPAPTISVGMYRYTAKEAMLKCPNGTSTLDRIFIKNDEVNVIVPQDWPGLLDKRSAAGEPIGSDEAKVWVLVRKHKNGTLRLWRREFFDVIHHLNLATQKYVATKRPFSEVCTVSRKPRVGYIGGYSNSNSSNSNDSGSGSGTSGNGKFPEATCARVDLSDDATLWIGLGVFPIEGMELLSNFAVMPNEHEPSSFSSAYSPSAKARVSQRHNKHNGADCGSVETEAEAVPLPPQQQQLQFQSAPATAGMAKASEGFPLNIDFVQSTTEALQPVDGACSGADTIEGEFSLINNNKRHSATAGVHRRRRKGTSKQVMAHRQIPQMIVSAGVPPPPPPPPPDTVQCWAPRYSTEYSTSWNTQCPPLLPSQQDAVDEQLQQQQMYQQYQQQQMYQQYQQQQQEQQQQQQQNQVPFMNQVSPQPDSYSVKMSEESVGPAAAAAAAAAATNSNACNGNTFATGGNDCGFLDNVVDGFTEEGTFGDIPYDDPQSLWYDQEGNSSPEVSIPTNMI